MKSRRSHRRAFTVLEVMTVLVVLSVLGAIVIPRPQASHADISESSVRTQLRQVRSAIEMYRARHYGRHPARISTLITEQYLSELPEHPGPASYHYDPMSGEFWSPVDPSW